MGTALSALFVVVLRGNGFLPDADVHVLPWELVLPVVAVVLATWGAFAAGSRRVLTVTPLEALSSSVEPSHDDVRSGTARKVWAIVLMAGGAVLMLLGLAVELRCHRSRSFRRRSAGSCPSRGSPSGRRS